MRSLHSLAALLFLTAVLQLQFQLSSSKAFDLGKGLNNHSGRSLQQQQHQVGVRGAPFETHQELLDSVDAYLDYHHADETSKNLNRISDWEQALDIYGPIEYWNVGRLDNFANIFNAKRNPLAAAATPNLSQWNVGHDISEPIYLQDMFLGATLVNFDVSFWKTDRAIHFNGMFENAVNFEGIGLETWNVEKGILFMSMFSGCTGLHRDLDLSAWQLRSAERMDSMFRLSSYGGTVGGDLCVWNDFLRSSATVNNMFFQSHCISTVDPNLVERNNLDAELSLCSPCDKSAMKAATAKGSKPNILLIMADQMRFDMIRLVQDELEHYRDTYKIETPNLNKLLQSGAYFRNAYVSESNCNMNSEHDHCPSMNDKC